MVDNTADWFSFLKVVSLPALPLFCGSSLLTLGMKSPKAAFRSASDSNGVRRKLVSISTLDPIASPDTQNRLWPWCGG